MGPHDTDKEKAPILGFNANYQDNQGPAFLVLLTRKVKKKKDKKYCCRGVIYACRNPLWILTYMEQMI